MNKNDLNCENLQDWSQHQSSSPSSSHTKLLLSSSSLPVRDARGKPADFEDWLITASFVLPSSLSLCLGFQYKLHVPRSKGRILSGISCVSGSL